MHSCILQVNDKLLHHCIKYIVYRIILDFSYNIFHNPVFAYYCELFSRNTIVHATVKSTENII